VTATTDMAGHPDVTEISDLTEGRLTPSRTASVRQHLDQCPLCAEVLDSLEEIRDLLGTVPAPLGMPEDVADRIDSALATEASRSSPSEEGPTGVDGPTGIDVSRETSSLPETSGADETTPEADETSGADGTTITPGPVRIPAPRPAGHPRGAAGPGRKSGRRGLRGRRRVMAMGTVLTVAVLGIAGLVVQSLGGTSSDSTAHNSALTFSDNPLRNQVTGLLSSGKTKSGSPYSIESGPGASSGPNASVDGTGITENQTMQQPSVPLPDCIRAGLRRDDDALATKEGTYDGKKALLVLFPDTSNTSHVMAYVVDTTCRNHPSVGPAQVLVERSYARP
jgi:hypothetical protein